MNCTSAAESLQYRQRLFAVLPMIDTSKEKVYSSAEKSQYINEGLDSSLVHFRNVIQCQQMQVLNRGHKSQCHDRLNHLAHQPYLGVGLLHSNPVSVSSPMGHA